MSESKQSISVILVSHGGLAEEFLAAARQITGDELEHFSAVALEWSEGTQEARAMLEKILEERGNNGCAKTLILADLFGDTPCKAAMSFVEAGRVELISGVNLPMVVKLGCMSQEIDDLTELATWARMKAQGAIQIGSSLLAEKPATSGASTPPPRRP